MPLTSGSKGAEVLQRLRPSVADSAPHRARLEPGWEPDTGLCSAHSPHSPGRGEQARVWGPPHGPELLPADGGHSGAPGTLGPSPAWDWGFLGPGLESPHAATPRQGLSQRDPRQPAPVRGAAVSALPAGLTDLPSPSSRQPCGARWPPWADPVQRRCGSSGVPLRCPRAGEGAAYGA